MCPRALRGRSAISAEVDGERKLWIARAVIECNVLVVQLHAEATPILGTIRFGHQRLVARRWGAAPHDAAVELQDIPEHNTADENASLPAAGRAVSVLLRLAAAFCKVDALAERPRGARVLHLQAIARNGLEVLRVCAVEQVVRVGSSRKPVLLPQLTQPLVNRRRRVWPQQVRVDADR